MFHKYGKSFFVVIAILFVSYQVIQACKPSREEKPVCGSNGQTYYNKGSFFCAEKWLKQNSTVEIAHEGPCNTTKTSS